MNRTFLVTQPVYKQAVFGNLKARTSEELMGMLSQKMKVNEVVYDDFVKASKPLYDGYPKEFGKDGKWILDQVFAARK